MSVSGTLRTSIIRPLSWAFPEYFGGIAARVFLRPRRLVSDRRPESSFSQAVRRSVMAGDREVPFWQMGTGPAVLMVHGWEQDHHALQAFVSPLLEAGYSVVAPDLPAHGEAPGRSAPLPQLAQAISAVANRVAPLHGIIAHSLGAAMTVLAAEQHGLPCRRVVLIGAPCNARDHAFALARRQGMSGRALKAMERQVSRVLGEPLERYRVDRGLSTLEMPVLLVHARDDAVVPFQDAITNAASGSAEHLWLGDGGHNAILAEPRVIQETVAFLGRGP